MVNISKFSPLEGSSYIKLPKDIENKKAVVNVHNQDERCFLWAVLSALHPACERPSCISSYKDYINTLKLEGMNFPVQLKDISQFETKNNISIHVFGLENNSKNNKHSVVGPLYYSDKKFDKRVNLLLITDELKSHYCWIKNLSRLVSSQISSNEHKKHFCDGCLSHFGKENLLSSHRKNKCDHIDAKIPSTKPRSDGWGTSTPENILEYRNYQKQMEVPFVVYADFESILKPIHTSQPNPQHSFQQKTYHHEVYSFAYIIKRSFDNTLSPVNLYRGEDAAAKFVKDIESDLGKIYNDYLKNIVRMEPLSDETKEKFKRSTVCGICEKPFLKEDTKVQDHCHLTGKFRFAAHSTCNLGYKIPTFIPIICHNMSGYDCHLFIKQLCSYGSKVDVIAKNEENYISFSKYLQVDKYVDESGKEMKKFLILRFTDSFKFMASSLENLGNNLKSEFFFETKKHFPDESKFKLMRQKGVFPYNFVDSPEKLKFKSLPSKDEFYDKLNEEAITEADYERAKEVWKLFHCRDLGEYSDIYLKSDVLLLCDVFQNFRRICLEKYNLDPAHYYTAPGLAWDAMMKLTGARLELLTDKDMIDMLGKGIRGGISQCCERNHIANNKFLETYDDQDPSSFITYLDATNLYGHSMSQLLPAGGFAWLTEDEIQNFDVMQIGRDSPQGFILEVDVRYPQGLHDPHSDLPFLVEKILPNPSSKVKKLIPNLNDKSYYVVHYKNLQQAIENGLVLTKIHRILKFDQSRWLKKYIDLNTEMRNEAKNKFEKDFYKLMNNAVYGKTMENVENRKDIRLCTHWESIGKRLGAVALIAKPNFISCTIFSENLVAVHLQKRSVTYNKPTYIGFCVLELSKTVLYNFFYNVIKKKYGENASLLYTDTDSLILKIKTDDFYEFIRENINLFDTSNYKPDNKFNIPVNQSVLGRMKDEFPEDPIVCFYGTGAKAYYVQSSQNELKRAKGVTTSVTKKNLTIDDYKDVVEKGRTVFRKMNTFVTYSHDMYTVMKNRVALCPADDKRFLIPNTTKTLAWGHFRIPSYEQPQQD